PENGRYTRVRDIPEPVDHTVSVSQGGNLYVTGGWTDGRPTNKLWRYSPATDSWKELASMRAARGSPAGAVIGDRIYIAGGVPGGSLSPTAPIGAVEYYDIKSGRWHQAPSMPT